MENEPQMSDLDMDILNALIELVQVKDWKDKYGEDEHYQKVQPIAWDNARKAIDAYKKWRLSK